MFRVLRQFVRSSIIVVSVSAGIIADTAGIHLREENRYAALKVEKKPLREMDHLGLIDPSNGTVFRVEYRSR